MINLPKDYGRVNPHRIDDLDPYRVNNIITEDERHFLVNDDIYIDVFNQISTRKINIGIILQLLDSRNNDIVFIPPQSFIRVKRNGLWVVESIIGEGINISLMTKEEISIYLEIIFRNKPMSGYFCLYNGRRGEIFRYLPFFGDSEIIDVYNIVNRED